MVTVYQARVTDVTRAETTITQHKGTAEWIAMLPGGEIIPNTAEEVELSELDGQGRYIFKTERQ
jgi:hypothetical protein